MALFGEDLVQKSSFLFCIPISFGFMSNLFLSLDYPCSELHIEEGVNDSGSIEALRNDLRRVDMDQAALL